MEIGAIGKTAATNVQQTVDSGQISSTPVSTSKNETTVQTANAVKQASAPPSSNQVQQAVDEINKSMQSLSRDLVFSIDKDADKTVVKIVDQKTSEVIRQIPSEESLAIAKSLDKVIGNLIQQKA